jgi:signal peptidase I
MNNRSTKDNNFIPIINLIMFPVIWVETLRSFGKRSGLDTF